MGHDYLNGVMEFDHVIRVNADGTVTEPVPGVYAPELLMPVDSDGQILAEHEQDYAGQAARQGWSLLTGWTGQYGYRGFIMHPSEYIGGALADHIAGTPGLYVVVTVETDDDSEDAAGWAIAYRGEPETVEQEQDRIEAAVTDAETDPYRGPALRRAGN